MDMSSLFLTEKEEQALRRMEKLTELRRASSESDLDWRAWVSFGSMSVMPGYAIYQFFVGPLTKASIGLLLVGLLVAIVNFVYFIFIQPMKRRIEALTQVVEEEAKRLH